MRRRLILAAALALFVAGAAFAASYRLDLGTHADDATALAYLQARQWDTNGDGTGNPQEGTTYWDSDDDKGRVWTGAAWADVPGVDSTALHTGDTGAALTYIDQDVTSGSSPVLAATNMTGSAAGLDSNATAHASADGASHTYIDQDVTSGSSPTFDGANFSGLPSSGDTVAHSVDLTGTYDWSANGDASQDTTSGFYAYEIGAGELAAATLEVGAGVITWSVTGTTDPDDHEIGLVLRLDAYDFPDLYLASVLTVTIEMDLSAMGSISGDNVTIYLANEDVLNTAATESIRAIMKYDGANRAVNLQRVSNGAGATSGASSNVANWAAATTRMTMRETVGFLGMDHFDAVGDARVTPATIEEDGGHVRAGGANAPYLVISMRGKGDGATPGTSAGTISAITVSVMFLASVPLGLRRRLDPYGLAA
jgi:hypothetical protein